MIPEIAGALESLNVLIRIVKNANGVINQAEIDSAVYDMQQKLIAVLAQNSSLSQEVNLLQRTVLDLESEAEKLKYQKTDMERYSLYAFPGTGSLVYALKEGMENGEPVHYLCASCYDQSKKSTLQPGNRSLRCPLCKNVIYISKAPPLRAFDTGIV